jgi:SAM-dependent methyltransferase
MTKVKHEADRDSYMMSRNNLASGRLTAQHYLIVRRLGWLIHPDIHEKVRNCDELEIMDVACGNAVWVMDMAQQYPRAHISGIDISCQQFPPQFTWPPNVRLEQHDMFAPFPERLVGRFDIVQVRLVMVAVYSQNKDWIMHNISRLLKPGGYLQWIDASIPLIRALSSPQRGRDTFREPPAITTHLTSFFACVEWLRHLPEELARHGLINLLKVDMPPVPWLSRQETDNAVWALTDIHEGLTLRAPKEVADSFGQALQETIDDIKNGRVFYTTYYTTIGQKA